MIERVAATRATRQPARLQLTFACELDAVRLTALVADATVLEALRRLGARVTLMLSDFSPARADAVRALNAARIPVVGIPLMPYEDGYYFTIDNASRALARYDEWRSWTARHGLVWAGVGLDIEPEARVYEQIMRNPWGLLPMLGPRLFTGRLLREAQVAYTALVERIRADGYRVENYQFPLITDERRAGSTLLQRLLGLVDVATDREVWMLYSSVMRRIGPALLWVYGAEAKAIAVGTTGGGPDIPSHPQIPALSWDELARDLALASRWTTDIYIHSLEGCVSNGFLERLQSYDVLPAPEAPRGVLVVRALRAALRMVLWGTAHPWWTLGVLGGVFLLVAYGVR